AALVAVAPQFSGRADVDGVAVGRVDGDLRDALGVLQADFGPVVAAVGGLVHAVPDGDAVARPGLAGAGPDRLRILRIDGDRADRLRARLVEDGLERRAAVDRLPDAAARRADVEGEALSFAHAVERGDASAHHRGADVARAESGDGVGVDFHRPVRRRGRRGTAGDLGLRRRQHDREDAFRVGGLREERVVQIEVRLDGLVGDGLLERAAFGVGLHGVGEEPAVDGLVVAEGGLVFALGAAHHLLRVDLDRHVVVGVQVVVADVAAGEGDFQFVGIGAVDLFGAGVFDLVALLLIVDERSVEVGVFDDLLELFLAEGLDVLLAVPGLELSAVLSFVRGDAGHA